MCYIDSNYPNTNKHPFLNNSIAYARIYIKKQKETQTPITITKCNTKHHPPHPLV